MFELTFSCVLGTLVGSLGSLVALEMRSHTLRSYNSYKLEKEVREKTSVNLLPTQADIGRIEQDAYERVRRRFKELD